MRDLVRGVLAVILVFFGLFGLVILVVVAVAVWDLAIEPRWEARDLYQAAGEARSRPYVEDAAVHLDWLDGSTLSVYPARGATGPEITSLWCDVLFDVGGEDRWVEVVRGNGHSGSYPPSRTLCADPSPALQMATE